MRFRFCIALSALLLSGSSLFAADPPAGSKDDREDYVDGWENPKPPAGVKGDERRLETAHLKHDGPSLLAVLRKRTLTPANLEQVKTTIRQLGDESFKVREHAVSELVARGPVVIELLKKAVQSEDLEVSRRAERCLQKIKTADYKPDVLPALVRLLAHRKPSGTIEVLLAYLPFADQAAVVHEVKNTLTALALREGKADHILVAALSDPSPLRRAVAGEVLSRAGAVEQKAAVRRLLQDPEGEVRFRIALVLAKAGQRDAVPVLIDTLPLLPQGLAWQAEDFLYHLSEGHNPPAVALGSGDSARRKARDIWAAWWKANESMIDLGRLRNPPQTLGYTALVLLDEGRILEVDRNNEIRWQVAGLFKPLDLQLLPGDRLLVAEYDARRISERNHKGEILWQQEVEGPLVGQRLANGNTFIATDVRWFEVDRDHREVFSHIMPAGEKIMKAVKTPKGEVVCLTNEPRIVKFDAGGKVLETFPMAISSLLYGGRIDVLPGGRVLVPHNGEDKVVEYDANAKEVWKVNIDRPVAAVRLPNGHTLVTTLTQNRAIEFDQYGNEVWQYRAKTRVTRALRR